MIQHGNMVDSRASAKWRGICKMASPFADTIIVYRWRVRGKRRWLELANAVCLCSAIIVLAVVVRYSLFDFPGAGRDSAVSDLSHWVSPVAISSVIVMMVGGVFAGAAAAPRCTEAEEVHSSLVSGISGFGICTGRLIAGLRVPIATLVASLLAWTIVQAAVTVVPRNDGGLLAVLIAHFVLLCTLAMTAAASFACEIGSIRGRLSGAGIVFGILLSALLILTPLLINQRLQTAEDPTRLIGAILTVNPVNALANSLGRDILHTGWIYNHTTLADYQVGYSSPLISGGIFLFVAAVAHMYGLFALKRAYR